MVMMMMTSRVLLQREGSETKAYCVYDVAWINSLRIQVITSV